MRRSRFFILCWGNCYVSDSDIRNSQRPNQFFGSNDRFLYMGGPLLAGLSVVVLSSLAPMALPLGMRGLAITESISLYGGLAVFGGFVLYEYVYISFPI